MAHKSDFPSLATNAKFMSSISIMAFPIFSSECRIYDKWFNPFKFSKLHYISVLCTLVNGNHIVLPSV